MLEALRDTFQADPPCGSLPFYCLQTKPQQEFRARDNLLNQELDTYLPLNASGRPLFTSYLFARVPLEQYVAVRSSYGVARIITLSGLPYEVPEDTIELVRTLASEPVKYSETEIQVGSHVRIKLGTYYGQTGKVEKLTPLRMIVLLDSLATFRCEVPPSWAEKAPKSLTPQPLPLAYRDSDYTALY